MYVIDCYFKPNTKHEEGLLWGNATAAIEKALASGDCVMQAYVHNLFVSSIVEEVAKIPGNITEIINYVKTVQ
jgi:hypothetical protein